MSSHKIAVISLCIAIVSIMFSGYQWWNGLNDSRISAAVDFSMKYFTEENVLKERTQYIAFMQRLQSSIIALSNHRDFTRHLAPASRFQN